MKYICFADEVPAIIGGGRKYHRQPRKFTRWISTLFYYIFTKEVK